MFVGHDEVLRLTGLKNSTRRAMEKRGEFPQRIPISERLTAYERTAVIAWCEARLRAQHEAAMRKTSLAQLLVQARRTKRAVHDARVQDADATRQKR